ncbi:MAG TPA: type VI secretion system baseplate subunit TssG [Stellaceae bacterium]|jgi:type VI secretion system protein ImpH
MPADLPRPGRSPSARLHAEPRRFAFDAAVRVLTHAADTADPAEAARFRTVPGLAYPPADILAVAPATDGRPAQVAAGMIGLAGVSGVLPRPYTEFLTASLRHRSVALHEYLDLLSHRLVAFFARAGGKYRLNRAAEAAAAAHPPEPDRAAEALLAFTGYATPSLAPRLAVGVEPLLYYAGLFAGRPRSAEKLAALVSDWLGRKVEVEQFAGTWLSLPPDQRTALAAGRQPGTWNRLGVDAAIGVRAWDLHARIILRIGPLDRAAFEALLPDRPGLQRLVSLVRAFLGFEIGFAVNPVLAGPEVPSLRLDHRADPPPRLGWNSWIAAPGAQPLGLPRADAADAVFEAEIVEAEELAGKARN